MRQRILISLCIMLSVSAIRAEGENVELVGRIPFGSALDIYVVENYAYLCAGGTLIIVDVIDPANPVEVGRIDTPGIACAVYVVGGHAYVADGPQGLRVIDVSDPENPREVGSYVPFYYRDSGTEICSGVHVAGKYAYLIWRGNLHVVDISDPANPQEVTIYNSKAMGFHVAGDYAYLTEFYGGLHVIDISNPGNPQEVGFCEFQSEAEGVYVVGNYAYVAAGYDGLRVIDVSNPRMPREMGSCYIAGYATDVFTAGKLAYVAACYGILRVIDVSDPKNLREVGACYGPPSSATGVYVAGDHAYLINDPSRCGTLDWSGLAVLDISSPHILRATGFYYTHHFAEAVQVAGSYAYVADGTAGLRIIDISDPEKPDEIGFYDAPINAIELYVAGNYAYVIDTQEALHIVDVSDPRNPHEVSVYPVYLHDVFVAGNYAYIAASRDGLLVIDVSDPANPRKVGSYDLPDDSAIISDVCVVGDYAYVIGMKTGFRILDISDPANPRELGSYQISGNICIAGRYAYIGTQVIDISDPTNPRRVGYSLEFSGMHIAGSYAYLTKGKDGILVLDISEPERPRQVGSYNTPGYAKGVYAVGDYAYVADGYGGLCILKYVGPSVVGNDPPVGNPQSLITDVNTPIRITLTASDPDGDALTFQIESQPANGSLSGTVPNLTYQPNPGFVGTDSFIFTVHDGFVSSKPASVTIKVQHTPVAISQSVETVRDTPVQITLTGSDADGDTLTFEIVRQPISGSLSGTAPDLTYEPKPGFVGIDSIIFTAHDGFVNSEPATVNIEIRPPNYYPVADPQTVTTNQNTPVQITLTGTDPDGDELTFEFVQPAYGSLSGTAPNLTYHPKHGYTGRDRFSFRVYDGELWSSAAEVTVIVEKTDRWNVELVGSYDPRGFAQGVRVVGSYAYVISAKAAGKGIEGLHVVDVSDPAEPYEVAFYEIPGILDGIYVSGDCAYVSAQTGTILNRYVHFHVVNISAPGNPYIAGSYRLLESWPGIAPKPHGIYVTGGYAYVADSACGLRVIAISNPAEPQQVGLCAYYDDLWDVFVYGSYAYTASLGPGCLDIVDVSDPSKPERLAGWGSPFDKSYAIYVTGGYAYLGYSFSTGLSVFDVFDPERPRLLGVQGIPGRLGDIHVAENLAYVAEIEGGFRVIDVSDPENLQEVGFYDTPNYTIGIHVSGDYIYIADGWGGLQILKYTGPKPTVNSPPIAAPQSLTTNQDTPVQITLTGRDPDGDELTFEITSQPENGSLSGVVPDLTYTPNPGFAGEDSLTFRAYDGNAWSEPAAIGIKVNADTKSKRVGNMIITAESILPLGGNSYKAEGSVSIYGVIETQRGEESLSLGELSSVTFDTGTSQITPNSSEGSRLTVGDVEYPLDYASEDSLSLNAIQASISIESCTFDAGGLIPKLNGHFLIDLITQKATVNITIDDSSCRSIYSLGLLKGEWDFKSEHPVITLEALKSDLPLDPESGPFTILKSGVTLSIDLNTGKYIAGFSGKMLEVKGSDGAFCFYLIDIAAAVPLPIHPLTPRNGTIEIDTKSERVTVLDDIVLVFDPLAVAKLIQPELPLPEISPIGLGVTIKKGTTFEYGPSKRLTGKVVLKLVFVKYARLTVTEADIGLDWKSNTFYLTSCVTAKLGEVGFEVVGSGITIDQGTKEQQEAGQKPLLTFHAKFPIVGGAYYETLLVYDHGQRSFAGLFKAGFGFLGFDFAAADTEFSITMNSLFFESRIKFAEVLNVKAKNQISLEESSADALVMSGEFLSGCEIFGYQILEGCSYSLNTSTGFVAEGYIPLLIGSVAIRITIDLEGNVSIDVEWGDLTTPLIATGFSPIDIELLAPGGEVVSKEVKEISNAIYSERDIDGDGDLDDEVIIPVPVDGDYRIMVIPEPDALPADTYTLQVSYGEGKATEFKDVAIGDIPQDGYVFDTITNQLTISTVSENPPGLSISPEKLSVQKDGIFTVNIEINKITDLFGASFEIQYDGNILEYVSSSAGDFMGSDVVFFSIKGNNSVNITISMKAGTEPASGSGTLVVIKFKARSAGKSQVSYREDTLALNHSDGTPIPVTVSNCSVTVGEGIIKGDVNNDRNVRSNDAILALRIASGLIEPTPEQRQAADMNDDGMVRSNDAILILRKAAGLAAPGINTHH